MLIRRAVEKGPWPTTDRWVFSIGTRKTHPSGWVGDYEHVKSSSSENQLLLSWPAVRAVTRFFQTCTTFAAWWFGGQVIKSYRCVWQSAWVCFVSAGLRRSQRSLAGMISLMRCEVLLSPLYRTSAVQVLSFRPIIPCVCVSQVCFLISLMDGSRNITASASSHS